MVGLAGFFRVVGLRSRVPRGPYLAWGLGLALLKFAIDTALVYAFTGTTWSPLGYVVPSMVLRSKAVGSVPDALNVALVVTALPFLWIGLTMSVRRAADAGLWPWLGAGFLVPILNYVTIAVLAAVPTNRTATWSPPAPAPYRAPVAGDASPESAVVLPPSLRGALLGMLACIAIGMGMIVVSVYGLGAYGTVLFFVTPFTMGAVSSAVYNARGRRSLRSTIGVALAGTMLTGLAALLFAVEGILCLAMAFPISGILASVGALIAWLIGTSPSHNHRSMALVLLPAAAFGEARLEPPQLAEVTTAIEIDAPPERVWTNVVGFSELPAPPEWFFRLGVAYPVRATIDGQGVGAVRRCEFSTGAFVEPITVWDAPKRLAFDVTAQPPSLSEWSPYRDLKAPHLEGYMTSKGGEFRLMSLPGGRTRLEGTTHYALAIHPQTYWRPYAELLLHAIHRRVLVHIKQLTESNGRQPS